MRDATRVPFGNMHFRLEIEGMRERSVVEVIFPEARISAGPRRSRVVHYGTLIVKRGVTRSAEWYEWWDQGRRSNTAKRTVAVVLLDARGADVHRWTFDGVQPLGYFLSNLNALGNAPLIETLEMSVAGFQASFDLPAVTPRKRK